MLRNYMGILTLNEDDSNIRSLTKVRPIASIPIFGRYRVIDFMLSNMVNSSITNVVVFTLGNSRSLRDHLGTGKPWDLNRKIDGLYIFSHGNDKITLNELNLIKSNQESLLRSRKENVILSSSNMICNINLDTAVQYHESSGADVTIVYKKIDASQNMFIDCSILNFYNQENKVVSVGKNFGQNDNCAVSMEIFIMSKKTLIESVDKAIQLGNYSTVRDFVYANVSKLNIIGYEFTGYLGCINSAGSYYKVSMDLLAEGIMPEIFSDTYRIYTKSNDSPPTKYLTDSEVSNSFIANGCIIDGIVQNSILSRGVIVEKGAKVIDSVVFARCKIGKNAIIKNAILDKAVEIGDEKVLVGDMVYPMVVEKGSKLL